jgi:hypothetical protein
MKLGIIIGLTLFSATTVVAQNDHVRKLKDYPYNASIRVNEKYCVISCDKNTDSFLIARDAKNMWRAKNNVDVSKVNLLQFTTTQQQDLKVQYDTVDAKKYAGMQLLEQLINRAADKGGNIKFVNEKESGATANVDPTSEANPENQTTVEDGGDLLPIEKKNNDVLLWSLAGITALLTGLLIREKMKTTSKNSAVENVSINTSISHDITNANQQIVQLQATNHGLLEQLRDLQQQLKDVRDADAAYFENALLNLVNPAKTALNKQQKGDALSLAMQILVQYIAITHTKTERRQGSDDYNVKQMKGEALSVQEKQNSISASTPADAIPNEIKTILQILKDNQVAIPQGLAYMGYQIQ